MELHNIFHFARTFTPIDKGDPFIVIACQGTDVVLGLRLTLTAFKISNGSVWVSILGALCARNRDFSMEPMQANDSFGGFQFKMESGECMSKTVCPLATFPCSPAEVFEACSRLRPQLEKNYVEQIVTRLTKGGNSLCIPENVLESMLSVRLDDLMPDLTPVFNEVPRFLFLPEISESGYW